MTADLPGLPHLESERARVARFRDRIGVSSFIDVHTHFMPERLLEAVWRYFDSAGPLVGRPWPIRYRAEEQTRVEMLRGFGVRAFTSMLYPHKPGMARSLNDWAADFAARTPDCVHTATFFAEPSAAGDVRRAIGQGARVFKVHLQVGDFDPNDPLLDDAWGILAEAGLPVVTHCGSGPVPGRYTGPAPIEALLARYPRLRLVVAHLGWPEYTEFLDLAERYDSVLLDTTMAFTRFTEEQAPFPRADLPRLEAFGDRVLLGTDFPNIPYSYADALEAPEDTGLSNEWLRAVCHDNAAKLFALLSRYRWNGRCRRLGSDRLVVEPRDLQGSRSGQVLGETEGGAVGQRRHQRRLILGLEEVEVAAALVGGGWISGDDLVDPPGRLSQYVALHHLRNQDEAPLGELVDLLIGQHVTNVEAQYSWQQKDFGEMRL
jgi:hypothetical protein